MSRYLDDRPAVHQYRGSPGLDLVVERLKECANDGLPCEVCPVERKCRAWFDSHPCNRLTKGMVPRVLSIIGDFQQCKRNGGNP